MRNSQITENCLDLKKYKTNVAGPKHQQLRIVGNRRISFHQRKKGQKSSEEQPGPE